MGRPKKYATAEDEEAQRERRRVASREHMRRLRSDPAYCAEVAARKRQRRAEVREYLARNVEYQRTLGNCTHFHSMDSARLERQRALARERMRRRRADSAVRAKESAAKRRRREANPEVRKKATEAKRRQRQANPDLVRKEAEARRLRRLANPGRRKKASQAKRRKDNPELRNKEPQVKRTWWRQEAEQSRERPEFPLTEGAADGRFERDDLALIYVCIPYSVDKRTAVQQRGSMLLELTPAAEHVPPHLVRKGNSLTQCKVPVVSKSSQADFKPRSRSVGVQAQQGKKIPASSVRRKSAAAEGISAAQRSAPEAADVALRLWEELQSRHSDTAS